MALVGKLFAVKNSLILFKIGLIFEEYLYVYGMYLLSKYLFTRRAAILFVSIGAILTTLPQAQIFFGLRLYYLLPLVLLFLMHFFDETRFYYLWLAGIFEIISLVGTLAYFAPIHLFILIVFVISLIYYSAKNIYEILLSDIYSPLSLTAFIMMCVIAYIYVDMTTHLFSNIMVYARQRPPGMTSNTFSGFIDYLGGSISNLWEFIYAAPATLDHTLFIGTIPIVFIIYAITYDTKKIYLPVFAITALFIAMLSFSRATFVDYIIYYVIPYMSNARHLGLMLSSIKLFLLVIAGFGVNRFYSIIADSVDDGERANNEIKKLVYIGIALIMFIVFVDSDFNNGKYPYSDTKVVDYSFHFFSIILLVFLLLYLIRLINNRDKLLRGMIIILYFIEIFSYYLIVSHGLSSRLEPVRPYNNQGKQMLYPYEEYQRDISKIKDTFNIRHYDYQKIRITQEELIQKFPRLELYMNANNSIIYQTYYVDVCNPKTKYDILPLSIDRFIRIIYSMPIDKNFINYTPYMYFETFAKDTALMKAIGCNISKLWIASDVELADNLQDAINKIGIVASSSDIHSNPVILRDQTEEFSLSNTNTNKEYSIVSSEKKQKIDGENINVIYFTANTIILEAYVDKDDGAWLIYSDSYHPNWTANVNGVNRSVAMANVAFKAVKLDKGNNRVVLDFKGNHRTLLYVKLLIGLSVSFWLFIVLITVKPSVIFKKAEKIL
ncbi:MAG: hypothetical protein HQK97_01205 [Nitrospirae bacterium]|nr:hypothetical protein [Nitrospirota bacterium]